PVTGQTLPIVSLGGSSLIFTCMSLGIILGVSRRQNELEHRRAVAEKRRLNIEEWQHVMFEEEGAGEIDSTKRIAYQGVVWHNPEDDRESCEEIEEQWNYGDYYDDDEKEEDYS
ncbi:MAG: FtsW/RodA/SpoVE family cell cycle protein, partial [Rikenellaceae bacterium]|nr:FtsW/RodA/SpoVE family cell cycle protein [Rikenellaceae bacterium]